MRFFWHHFCLIGEPMTLSIEQFRYATYLCAKRKSTYAKSWEPSESKYLLPNDKIIGLIGDAGSGKSLFIKACFRD